MRRKSVKGLVREVSEEYHSVHNGPRARLVVRGGPTLLFPAAEESSLIAATSVPPSLWVSDGWASEGCQS